MNDMAKNLILWVIIAIILLSVFNSFTVSQVKPQIMAYSDFIGEIKNGQIKEVTINGRTIDGVTVAGQNFSTYSPGDDGLVSDLLKNQVIINAGPPDKPSLLMSILINWFPILLLIGLWVFFMRQMQGGMGGRGAMSFGKSRARMLNEDQVKVTFQDVAGVEEAKEEVAELVEFLREPAKFQKLGGKIPRGVLMVGSPGTGKTLLARAIAGEAKVPFFTISGSDFVEMFVGVGASRVRDMFEQAKKHAPCLTGDTIVTLANGRNITIQAMFDNKMVGVQVPAMGEDFNIRNAEVLEITRKRSDDIYRIKAMHGEIKATGNHLFPVLRNGCTLWTRVDELQTGDYVAMPRHLPTAGLIPSPADFLPADTRIYQDGIKPRAKFLRLATFDGQVLPENAECAHGGGGWQDAKLSKIPSAATEDLMYLVGLMDADGSWQATRGLPFINTCEELHEHVAAIVNEVFGIATNQYWVRRVAGDPRQDIATTQLGGRLVKTILLGLADKILEMPSYMIAAWLRGIFDGDGCVQKDKVIISAWKPELNHKIRAALHRIGIVVFDSGRVGNIEITGKEDALRFVEMVGSKHPEKINALQDLMQQGRTASRSDAIPVGNLLREAREACGMAQRDFDKPNYISTYERNQVTPPRSRLQGIVEELENFCTKRCQSIPDSVQAIRSLVSGDTRWTQISAVEQMPGEDFVYDLCLDAPHNFVANGLFVHNCIIFIDEIDAVGRHRGAGLGGGHDEREQTLNQLLVEMDGFEGNEGVIVIAATNRPDVLDPALLRPGRFDRQVVVPLPDVRGREQILKVHMRKVPISEDVMASIIARATPGFSGADLANLVNEAALFAARTNKRLVDMADMEKAKDKIMMGAERRSMVMSEQEKQLTAYHEAGHAIVGLSVPSHDPVYKVSIIPRGRALGITMFLPEEDRYSHSKELLESQISSLFGGRIAEELIFGPNKVTTGASNDIQRATEIARGMVTRWGLSERLGPLTYSEEEQEVFLGHSVTQHKNVSDDTAHAIDEEIRAVIDRNYQRAKDILTTHLERLHIMADALIRFETINADQIKDIMEDRPPRAPDDWDDEPRPSNKVSSKDGLAKKRTRNKPVRQN